MKDKTFKLITILTIFILTLVFLYQAKDSIYAGLNALKLIPQNERLTELYFENSSFLPSQSAKGQPVNFSFTIHNLEGRAMYYAYSVYLEPVGGPRVILDSNVAILADGEYEKFIKSYKMETAIKQSKIVVSLNQQNEQIDFLLNRN